MRNLFLALFFASIIVSPVNAQSTLALQEKCNEGAKKLVSETGGCSPTTTDKDCILYCDYKCHYNKKLDRCFIRWDMKTNWFDSAPGELKGRRDETVQIMDVFEHKIIGEYDSSWGLNKVGNRQCNSRAEFETLVKPYMEE